VKPTRPEFIAELRRDYPVAATRAADRGLTVTAPQGLVLAIIDRAEAVGLIYRDFSPSADRAQVRLFGFRREGRS
jgi:hypothetical protein